MSISPAYQEFGSPVHLLTSPLRSKVPKVQSKVPKGFRHVVAFLKETHHYALSVRGEVFELTRRDDEDKEEGQEKGQFFIKRSALKKWEKKHEPQGWTDKGFLGYTKLSNDNIFYIAKDVIWSHWGQKYTLLAHDCQHFAELLSSAICERHIGGLLESSFQAYERHWTANAISRDAWQKKFPYRWNRAITEWPVWICCTAGGLVFIGTAIASGGAIVLPTACIVLYAVSMSSMAIPLLFRIPRALLERKLLKKLEKEVKKVLLAEQKYCKLDEVVSLT